MNDITLQKAPDTTLSCINGNITCKAREVISPLISPASVEALSYISVSSFVYCTAKMWINGEKRQKRETKLIDNTNSVERPTVLELFSLKKIGLVRADKSSKI